MKTLSICRRSQSLQSQDSLRKMPRLPSLTPQGVKSLWIRTALFEKVLDKIVLYLVENSRYVEKRQWHCVQLFVLQELYVPLKIPLSHLPSSKYYEKEAVLMDPVDGPILASLLGNYMSHCKHLYLFNVIVYKSLFLDQYSTQGHYCTLFVFFFVLIASSSLVARSLTGFPLANTDNSFQWGWARSGGAAGCWMWVSAGTSINVLVSVPLD